MRRGRIVIGAALLLCAVSLGGAPSAFASTPQDICADLADGHIDGTYTNAEWTAFFNDPTIQGYGCGGITPPVTPKPGTPTPQGGTSPVQVTPQAAQPVVVIAAVKGTRHTVTPTKTPVAGVQGAQHTVKAPVRASAAAPLATTKATGTLPFTGAQLALFALVGLALVAAGTLLRSTAKQPPRS